MKNWFKKRAESRTKVTEARDALAVTDGELVQARAIRADAAQTARAFERRAITWREIRLRNHITPSIFPPNERTYP